MHITETDIRTRRFDSRAALDAAVIERLEQTFTTSANTEVGPAIMLSGGSTPLAAYRALASRSLQPAAGLTLFYSDERYVPSTSEASNYHQSSSLIESFGLPDSRVLRVRTELTLDEATDDYDLRLADVLRTRTPMPLGLLGLGADGHTASLFSLADIERARGHLAIAVARPDGMSAVSVTPEFLANVETVLFLVAGADKRGALQALLNRSADSIAWNVISGCRHIEVWTEPAALPEE